MALQVDIWELNTTTFEDELRGTITWTGQGFLLRPDTRQLRRVLAATLWLDVDGELRDVKAGDDPELFMRTLSKHYKSAYFQASVAREVPHTATL